MLAYQLVLFGATLVSAASAGLIYAQAPDRRPSQLLAAILVLGSFWAGAELAVSMATTREAADFWMRWGALGWLPLGVLLPALVFCSLDLSVPLVLRPYRKLQLWITGLEGAWSLSMVFVVFLGDGVVEELIRTSWGWTFTPRPLLTANYVVVTVGLIVSSWVMTRCSRVNDSRTESIQLPWVWVAILAPSAIVFVTDVLIPALGVDFPRFGGASIALTGLIIGGTVIYFGMSFVTPRSFGDEIVDTLQDGVALVSTGGYVMRANQALARLCGRTIDELRGMPIRTLIDRELVTPTGLDDLHRELIHARGDRIPVAVSVAGLRERRMNEVGLVVVVRDLRELEDLRRSSMVNARLAAVGELAAGLAHEINNPIAFVSANLRQLSQSWKQLGASDLSDPDRKRLESEGLELVQESLEGVERAAGIVRGIKNFTYTGSSERCPAQLQDLIGECLKMLRPQVGPSVEITLDFEEMPPVVCCAQEMEQVFLNLLINATHAVEGSGRIVVSTRLEDGLAEVSVEDDGRGIAPEVLDRIFDPFFTTKPAGQGTGLGLGIAHQVVTRHGGVITVQSREGEGATFRVYLPMAPAGEARA